MRAKKMWRKYGVLFHVLMPLELAEKIYELSEKMDITYSDIIRQALREYFERLEGGEKEGLDKTQKQEKRKGREIPPRRG